MSLGIRKADIEVLGKELVEELDSFLHDEWVINTFPHMKPVQEVFDSYKPKPSEIEDVYCLLRDLNLDMEVDEDLYYRKNEYLDLFNKFVKLI